MRYVAIMASMYLYVKLASEPAIVANNALMNIVHITL